MQELLQQYGISDISEIGYGTPDHSGLVKLRKIYESLIAEMRAKTSVTKEDREKLLLSARENPEAVAISKSALSDSWGAIYKASEEIPESLVLMIDGLKEHLGILNFMLKELMDSAGVTDEQKISARKSNTQRFSDAAEIQKFLLSSWEIQKNFVNVSDPVFGENGDFPLKDVTTKSGTKTVPKISNLGTDPSAPKSDDAPTQGRPVGSKWLRYKWTPTNGETVDLPHGTSGHDVAKDLLSDRKNGVHVTWNDLKVRLADQNVNVSTDSWELTFDNGTLAGYIDQPSEV